MTSYFALINAKPNLKSNKIFDCDGSRPDMLLDQQKLSRARLLTKEKATQINNIYMDWCDFLFTGFNVAVIGAGSKFSLLETFKKMYLDSGRIPDFRSAINFNSTSQSPSNMAESQGASREPTAVTKKARPVRRATRSRKAAQGEPTSETPEPTKWVSTPAPVNIDPENCPMLDIVTVRIHGLDPIKMESFNHALLDIKDSRRTKDNDLKAFARRIRDNNQHYVFLIHSFEYLLRDCEDVFETIVRLYTMEPIHVHLVLSSDVLSAGKKLHNLKIKLRLAFFVAPISDSFLWEKMQLVSEFDGADEANNNTTVHRLFNDKTDMQSLKDIYQALDDATASIMKYIFHDYIDKCQANAADQRNEDEDYVPYALMDDSADGDDVEQNRMQPKRSTRSRAGKQASVKRATNNSKKKRQKKIETHLDFHHLLSYCESKFIIRRGAALRDHLGELKDHSIISDDEAGNKIQCLIDPLMCKKFLDWVEAQGGS